jgi:thiol-disulfide isomerase/thioredoxin
MARRFPLTAALLALALGTPALARQAAPAAPKAGDATEAKMYERMDKEDRDALAVNLGYGVPAFPTGLQWLGGDPWEHDSFRDKVTVIVALGPKAGSRATLDKIKKALPEGVTLLGLQTPDGAEKAKATYAKDPPCQVVVDAEGEWSDALGVFQRAANIVVDKSGTIKYVGLSELGLKTKLPGLVAEEFDASVLPRDKPANKAAAPAEKKVEWPEFLAPVGSAADQRGKPIPGFVVDTWITKQPTPGNRLVAVDFWATWCGPCKAAIPHVNELNQKYGADILFVGLSDEKQSDFTNGLRKSNLKPANFTYALALDPKKRLNQFFQIKGIPHMAIFSPDGIVRWQGHPMSLADADLDKLVEANRANAKPAAAAKPRSWAGIKAAKDQKSR